MLSGFPLLYQNKLREQGVQVAVNMSKIKLEPYGDLVDQTFSKFNENSIINQDPHSQIENDETPGAEYPNENDSEDTEIKHLQFLTLCQKYYQMMKSQKV